MPTRAVPTTADIETIRILADRTIRNLRITQCYHELSQAVAGRMGPAANWCTFATWASKQAGRTIRKEDFERTAETLLAELMSTAPAAALVAAVRALGDTRDIRAVRETVAHAIGIEAALERGSLAIAQGNLKVFEEIAFEFARFLHGQAEGEPLDDTALETFAKALRPGEPPDGQAYLDRAFRHYAAAARAEGKKRAELILLANAEIGFHEQTRLQPEIERGVDAAIEDPDAIRTRILERIPARLAWFVRLRTLGWRLIGRTPPLDQAIDALHAEARRRVRAFITERVMTIELPPDVRLRLGADVPGAFPAMLRHIENPELVALLRRIDPTSDSTRASGAIDWTDFDERIHFIADLFRRFQETADLHTSPFSPEQTVALLDNRLPAGRL